MDDPTSILEHDQRRIGAAGKWGGMVTMTRRCLCVLALVLLFVVGGVGSVPNSYTRAQESLALDAILFDYAHVLRNMGNPARADTVADADQEPVAECGCYEGTFSTRLIRHKTH